MFLDKVVKDKLYKELIFGKNIEGEDWEEMDPEFGVLNIQNVANFVYSNAKESYDPSDVFSFYLPFTTTWVEFRVPKLMVPANGEESFKPQYANSEIGVFCTPRILNDDFENPIIGIRFYIFIEADSTVISVGAGVETDLDFKKSVREEIHFSWEERHFSKKWFDTEERRKKFHDIVWGLISMVVPVVFTTLNFLHCKNVKIERKIVPPKLLKKREKKGKPFFVKEYTLAIEPMRKVLVGEGQSEKTGIKRAFHICRGHFRTYEETKKLFGKVSGTFWIEAHTRGSKDVGIVKK